MSREIKFRAFDSILGKMYQIQLDDADWDISALVTGNGWDVMQYTGLKDRNGVPIYEGDIVQHCDRPRPEKVSFFEGSFIIGKSLTCNALIRFNVPHNIEVIGNIYENPELLENDHE